MRRFLARRRPTSLADGALVIVTSRHISTTSIRLGVREPPEPRGLERFQYASGTPYTGPSDTYDGTGRRARSGPWPGFGAHPSTGNVYRAHPVKKPASAKRDHLELYLFTMVKLLALGGLSFVVLQALFAYLDKSQSEKVESRRLERLKLARNKSIHGDKNDNYKSQDKSVEAVSALSKANQPGTTSRGSSVNDNVRSKADPVRLGRSQSKGSENTFDTAKGSKTASTVPAVEALQRITTSDDHSNDADQGNAHAGLATRVTPYASERIKSPILSDERDRAHESPGIVNADPGGSRHRLSANPFTSRDRSLETPGPRDRRTRADAANSGDEPKRLFDRLRSTLTLGGGRDPQSADLAKERMSLFDKKFSSDPSVPRHESGPNGSGISSHRPSEDPDLTALAQERNFAFEKKFSNESSVPGPESSPIGLGIRASDQGPDPELIALGQARRTAFDQKFSSDPSMAHDKSPDGVEIDSRSSRANPDLTALAQERRSAFDKKFLSKKSLGGSSNSQSDLLNPDSDQPSRAGRSWLSSLSGWGTGGHDDFATKDSSDPAGRYLAPNGNAKLDESPVGGDFDDMAADLSKTASTAAHQGSANLAEKGKTSLFQAKRVSEPSIDNASLVAAGQPTKSNLSLDGIDTADLRQSSIRSENEGRVQRKSSLTTAKEAVLRPLKKDPTGSKSPWHSSDNSKGGPSVSKSSQDLTIPEGRTRDDRSASVAASLGDFDASGGMVGPGSRSAESDEGHDKGSWMPQMDPWSSIESPAGWRESKSGTRESRGEGSAAFSFPKPDAVVGPLAHASHWLWAKTENLGQDAARGVQTALYSCKDSAAKTSDWLSGHVPLLSFPSLLPTEQENVERVRFALEQQK